MDPILHFGPGTDFTILTYTLVVVILGGMGSLTGSAVVLGVAVLDDDANLVLRRVVASIGKAALPPTKAATRSCSTCQF
ncbi:MAG: hypothetical protein JOY96_01225 [Verrucomicrobia bacterium]|nr:hypothetical protein [Verrucomicrobiota bacterium]